MCSPVCAGSALVHCDVGAHAPVRDPWRARAVWRPGSRQPGPAIWAPAQPQRPSTVTAARIGPGQLATQPPPEATTRRTPASVVPEKSTRPLCQLPADTAPSVTVPALRATSTASSTAAKDTSAR